MTYSIDILTITFGCHLPLQYWLVFIRIFILFSAFGLSLSQGMITSNVF